MNCLRLAALLKNNPQIRQQPDAETGAAFGRNFAQLNTRRSCKRRPASSGCISNGDKRLPDFRWAIYDSIGQLRPSLTSL
jgi:hypothetical protein